MKKIIFVLILTCTINNITLYAQWIPILSTDQFGQTDPSFPIQSIGIGDFASTGFDPQSALHVNTNLLTPSGFFAAGEVFRTTCPEDISTYWRMWRVQGGNDSEFGNIYSLGRNDDYVNTQTGTGIHFYLQASAFDNETGSWGDIRFNSGNGGANSANNFSTPRMRILGNNGNVGIGDYDVFLPQSLLHQHVENGESIDTYHQFTNSNTGATSDQTGFRLGIELDGNRGMSDAHFRHFQNDGRFIFSSNDANGQMHTRMNIQRQTILGQEVTRVKIIEDELNAPNNLYLNSAPLSLLHLGHDWVYNAGGHRTWMDVGTFTIAQSDMMYTGMKNNAFDGNLWSTQMNAVISWGDNIQGPEGADDMQVIFNAPQTIFNGHAGAADGLEVMRFTPRARVGIGNFSPTANGNGSGFRPHRRLEIYDEHVLQANQVAFFPAAPQLRLTHTPAANVNNGIWTDFQTTNLGDLYIHRSSNASGSPLNRYVGINTSTPNNTLEINSGLTTPAGTRQIAGLRFTQLNNTLSAATNSTNKILSVDVNGETIMVNDIGAYNTSTCAVSNIIARYNPSGGFTFDCSDIFNDYSNSRIGMFNTTPNYNLHVLQPAMFSEMAGYWNLTHSTSDEYTLAVGCDIASNFHTGIGLFSNNGSTGLDRIQMYADDFGFGILRTFYVPYIIMNHENQAQDAIGTFIPTATLGTVPETGGVVIANDFYEEAKSPTAGGLANKYQSKLWVESNDWIIPASGVPNSGITPVIINNINTLNRSGSLYGLVANCMGVRPATTFGQTNNIASYFEASGADMNLGVDGRSISSNCLINVGGEFRAANATDINYGIRSFAPVVTCNATACATAAGYFSGWVYNTGNYVPSDATLKTNIQPLQFNDSILRNLPVYSYNFLTNNNFGMPLPDGNHYGVMSSDLQAVLPDMVRTFINPEEKDIAGNIISQEKVFDAVNYTELIPLLIAGYQQQASKLDSLTDALAAMQATVDNCCNLQPRLSNPNSNEEAMTVELENVKAIVLNQNEPNPFAEQTTITWNIPADDSAPLNAMLMFYDNTGSILKTVKINETGPGSLLVYGSKLSQGIYTYSLVVNNKTIDSKKMVKQK